MMPRILAPTSMTSPPTTRNAERLPQPSPGGPRKELPGWPLYLLFAGWPVWYVTGLSGFIGPILALPMLGLLLLRGHLRAPRGFGVWLLFVLWMAASAIEVDSGLRLVGFFYRASLYLSATVVFLYLYNGRSEALTTPRVAYVLTAFWVVVVAGGYIGLIYAGGSFSTPLEHVLPASFTQNSLVHTLVHPPFAQIAQTAYGEQRIMPRPSAPFGYTNIWGCNYSLLLPFVFVALARVRTVGMRVGLTALLVISLIPALLSLNRGMFLALGVGLSYIVLRLAARGQSKPLIGLVVFFVLVASVVSLLSVQQRVHSRSTASASADTRLNGYRAALDGTLKSPILGYGAPRPGSKTGTPSLGTQGQLWTLLYSHGFPGAALFVGWFLIIFWKSRRPADSQMMWVHVVLLMALPELLYYSMESSELLVVMIAAALTLRECKGGARTRTSQLPEAASDVTALRAIGAGAA